MLITFLLWFLALICHRIQSHRLRWKGEDGHSRYQGYPWLAMRWPGIKTEMGGRMAEPFICLFGGLVLLTVSKPLGQFVMLGAVTFTACMVIDGIVDWRRVQLMKDGEVEMRYLVERYRGR